MSQPGYAVGDIVFVKIRGKIRDVKLMPNDGSLLRYVVATAGGESSVHFDQDLILIHRPEPGECLHMDIRRDPVTNQSTCRECGTDFTPPELTTA